MIKVQLCECFGTGAMRNSKGQSHYHWGYEVSVMVKGSVKRAIKHARKELYNRAEDKEGFDWIPVYGYLKVWKDGKLIMEQD